MIDLRYRTLKSVLDGKHIQRLETDLIQLIKAELMHLNFSISQTTHYWTLDTGWNTRRLTGVELWSDGKKARKADLRRLRFCACAPVLSRLHPSSPFALARAFDACDFAVRQCLRVCICGALAVTAVAVSAVAR